MGLAAYSGTGRSNGAIGVSGCVLGESKVLVGPAQPSVRSGDDKDPPFAQCGARDAGNAGFLGEVRRVDNSDVDRNRKVAKLIELSAPRCHGGDRGSA